MGFTEWITLVQMVITILGFAITFLKISKEYKNSLRQLVFTDKKNAYIRIIRVISEISLSIEMIKEEDLYQRYLENKFEIELIGSADVIAQIEEFDEKLSNLITEYDILFSQRELIAGEIEDMRFILKCKNKLIPIKNKIMFEMRKDIKADEIK